MEKLNVLIIKLCLLFNLSVPKYIQIWLLLLIRKNCLLFRNIGLYDAGHFLSLKFKFNVNIDQIIPIFNRYNGYKYCGGLNDITLFWFNNLQQRIHFIHWCIKELKK